MLLGLAFLATPMMALAFSDIQITNPLYVPTTYMSEKEIIGGYPDGSFGPEKIINRAEALKIILLATEKPVADNVAKKFGDVPTDAWFAKFVTFAADNGIVSGDGATGNFVPARTVNRAEFLKMLVLAFDIDTSKFVLNVPSKDVPDDAWFAPYINFGVKFEIMSQDDSGMAFPSQGLTRGEAAEYIFNMLRKGQGLNPQLLLNLTEAHLVKALEFIEGGQIAGAGLVVTTAEQYAEIVSQISSVASNPVVQGAVKTTEALKHLVGAYSAGENGRLDDVVTASQAAWAAAEASLKDNPNNEATATQIKTLAGSLAEQAREAKANLPALPATEDSKTEEVPAEEVETTEG